MAVSIPQLCRGILTPSVIVVRPQYCLDHLRACFEALPADRAAGIDGITKERDGANLEENIEELSSRLRNMGYRPQPRRSTYVPKPGSEKGWPLAISYYEDKLVGLEIKRILEPIYEVQFEDSSYGYRPGRSHHQCLDGLGRTIQQRRASRNRHAILLNQRCCRQAGALVGNRGEPGCRSERYSAAATRWR